ncbi:phytoene desaturase family protein [Yoonia sp.]|uniref:phytoene desaturase family protein n=1 Tax=Yoonia sp. TaxID=2212373 RepID=UPI003975540B
MGDIDGGIGAWGFARGGMGAMSNAMAAAFEDHGGTIHKSAGVEEILTKNGRVTGVALEDGKEFRAPIVASNMDVKRTFLKHVDQNALPDDFTRAVTNFKIRGSSAKLNIALDRMPAFPAAPAHASFLRGDMHVSESLAGLERAYDDWKAGRWSEKPYIDMLIASQIDPTVAPKGAHMMTVFVQYAPYDLEVDGVRSGQNRGETQRNAMAETVLNQMSVACPDIRERVVHVEVRSPLELKREVGLTEGNIFQGELTFDQLFFNRSVPGYAQYETPIKGLYMCGSSAHPGGGVMAAPGANAARTILQRETCGKRMTGYAA